MDILTDKQYKAYNRLSRYSLFPIWYNTQDGKYESATTAYLYDETPYQLYTVKRNDSYDSIALEFYNNPTYFWIICSFNHIQDPFYKPEEGITLKIPLMSSIEFDI